MLSKITTIAAVLAVGLASPIPSFAAAKKETTAQKRETVDRAKDPQSFDACRTLAVQRGFSVSENEYRESARKFVRGCMAGKIQ